MWFYDIMEINYSSLEGCSHGINIFFNKFIDLVFWQYYVLIVHFAIWYNGHCNAYLENAWILFSIGKFII